MLKTNCFFRENCLFCPILPEQPKIWGPKKARFLQKSIPERFSFFSVLMPRHGIGPGRPQGGPRDPPGTLRGPSRDPPGSSRGLPGRRFSNDFVIKISSIFYHLGSKMVPFGVKKSRHNCALNSGAHFARLWASPGTVLAPSGPRKIDE